MASYQIGPVCYATAEAANAAAASSQIGSHLVRGSDIFVVDVVGVTATTITYLYTPVGSTGFPVTVQATPQPCGLLDWSDGLALGWGVGGAWLLAFAVLVMRKAAHS